MIAGTGYKQILSEGKNTYNAEGGQLLLQERYNGKGGTSTYLQDKTQYLQYDKLGNVLNYTHERLSIVWSWYFGREKNYDRTLCQFFVVVSMCKLLFDFWCVEKAFAPLVFFAAMLAQRASKKFIIN